MQTRLRNFTSSLIDRKSSKEQRAGLLAAVRRRRGIGCLTIGIAGWTVERCKSTAAHWMEISDVVCFHHYRSMDILKEKIQFARQFNRPVLCTEYMGTNRSNRFQPELAFLSRKEWLVITGASLQEGHKHTCLFAQR